MTEGLWTSRQATEATGGKPNGDWHCTGVAIDSRECEPGDLFVALSGENFDGHDFAVAALERGAAAVMISRHPDDLPKTAPSLRVPDTMSGLRALACFARARTQAKVIAVTGSVGKTGIKEAIRTALSRQASTHASVRSFNNHVGVPLSLARMPAASEYGVFELGMNQQGEIELLSRLARPHVAVITAIEAAHSGSFASLDDIARAKAEVFQGLESGGVVVVNRDSAQFSVLEAEARAAGVARILGFGEHDLADVRLLKYRLHDDCSCVSADVQGQVITYKIGIPGRHWVINSLAVLAASVAAGGDLGLSGLALAELAPLRGRGNRHEVRIDGDSIVVIDESYNANPASMRSAIAAISAVTRHHRGRRIAVLGDMLELGDNAATEHADLAGPLLEAGVDLVFTVGDNMIELMESLPKVRRAAHAASADEITPLVTGEVRPGDLVMIKGSNALGLSRVVKALIGLGEPDPGEAEPR